MSLEVLNLMHLKCTEEGRYLIPHAAIYLQNDITEFEGIIFTQQHMHAI